MSYNKEVIPPIVEKKMVGKTVIITGASRGMGRASALLFGQHGANVVVNYQNNKEAADAVVGTIKELGGNAVSVQADVGKMDDLQKIIDAAIDNFGQIDVLYHNAAVHYVAGELEDVTEEVWDFSYDMIIKGPFFLTKLAIPYLIKTKGNIIFTSTSSASTALPIDPQYMTAKNSVNALYRLLAGWLGSDGVRVNCVVPGYVKTDMFRHHPPEMWDWFASQCPLGRMAEPMDVAKAALFLASDDASYLTGVALPVDGGRTAAVPRNLATFISQMKPGNTRYEKAGFKSDAVMDVGLDVGLKD